MQTSSHYSKQDPLSKKFLREKKRRKDWIDNENANNLTIEPVLDAYMIATCSADECELVVRGSVMLSMWFSDRNFSKVDVESLELMRRWWHWKVSSRRERLIQRRHRKNVTSRGKCGRSWRGPSRTYKCRSDCRCQVYHSWFGTHTDGFTERSELNIMQVEWSESVADKVDDDSEVP